MNLRTPLRFAWLAPLLAATCCAALAQQGPDRGVNEWLVRMQEASRLRSYVGTFVVSSRGGAMSSARIWHVGDAAQQIERVEVLTGTPRSTIRRNEEVVTFLPEHRLVRTERREELGLFTNILKSTDASIPDFYSARKVGADRVAGFDADVVQLAPKDALRFGYKVWSEKRSGLVVKLQTLDPGGNVLEQSAFSELQLDMPIRPGKLAQMMQTPQGWRVERAQAVKTTAASEGWALRTEVAGFKPMSCYKRPAPRPGMPEGAIHWIFSDGLASVSLFLEPYDGERHQQEGVLAAGATQTLTRRIDDWWLTAVGEVPPQTLRAFALSLERRK
jgi:sigma-E factor negative regulatory protein RseB